MMNKPVSQNRIKGRIDNSLVFFIVAALSATLLFQIDAELPTWLRVTCGAIIGSFVVAGIFNMLFGYKGMGSNASSNDKNDDQNKHGEED